MRKIKPVDASRFSFDVHRDLSVTPSERLPGPPKRIDGMTMGVVTMEHSAPHGGEAHPDGDEVIYVISGRLRVTGDSSPHTPWDPEPGQACVIAAGEWHTVDVLEKTQFIHVTPGPNGDHRPPQS
ncbi:MAG: quercetin dioxygenase-like cupin family protein [Limisphaerales bacterium]|jgi:quercetin dioxygenase-like cupin family protein